MILRNIPMWFYLDMSVLHVDYYVIWYIITHLWKIEGVIKGPVQDILREKLNEWSKAQYRIFCVYKYAWTAII